MDSIKPGGTLIVGMRLQMDAGWHTYWRNPGDAGLPTAIHWKLPAGFRVGPIQWPSPQRFTASRTVSYGYSGDAMLLSEITAPPATHQGTSQVVLSATVKWLECRDICVPGRAELSIRLPETETAPQQNASVAELFAAARRQIPVPIGTGAYSKWSARATRTDDRIQLAVASPRDIPPPKGAEFFPYEDGMIENDGAQRVKGANGSLLLTMNRSRAPQSAQAQEIAGVLILNDRDHTVEISALIKETTEGNRHE